MMVHLQPVLALIHNDPRFYNIAAWTIVAPLLMLWSFRTMQGCHTAKSTWLAVAAIATLSLLPIYHRPHDAKILMLTLPACAALWAEKGVVAWLALLFTGGEILITSDLPLAALSGLSSSSQPSPGIINHLLFIAVSRPAGLVILAASIFYVWVYIRDCTPEPKNA